MENSKAAKITALVLFIAAPFVFFWKGFLPGNILLAYDTITLDMPFSYFAVKMFREFHQMPVWLPNIFCGIPLIDSANLEYFYPTRLIYLISHVPLRLYATLDMILHMWLAGAGMFLFLKKEGKSAVAAYFGSFVFMTAGTLVTLAGAGQLGQASALSLVPWVFYFAAKGIERKKIIDFFGAAFVISMQVFCLGMQVTAYSMFILIPFIIYKARRKDASKSLLLFAAALAFVPLFSAAQFFPTLDYMPFSWRAHIDDTLNSVAFAFHPFELLSLLLPSLSGFAGNTYWKTGAENYTTFFMGIVPLVMAAFAFANRERRVETIFWSACAAMAIMLSFGADFFLSGWVHKLPVMENFRYSSRFVFMAFFCITILASGGMDNMLAAEEKNNVRARSVLQFVFIVIAAGALVVFILSGLPGAEKAVNSILVLVRKTQPMDWVAKHYLDGVRPDFIALLVIAIAVPLAVRLQKSNTGAAALIVVALLLAIHFGDMLRVNTGYLKFGRFLQLPQPTERMKNDRTVFRVCDLSGYALENLKIISNMESAMGYNGNAMRGNSIFSHYVQPWTEFSRSLNVKYYMAEPVSATPKANGFDSRALERAYFAREVIPVTSIETVIVDVKSWRFRAGQAMVMPDPGVKGALWAGPVQITKYTAKKIELACENKADGFLVLSNTYYPGWVATVNGVKTKIYEVNGFVQGIKVPAGKNRIVFEYGSGKYILYSVISFVSCFGFGVWCVMDWRRRKNEIKA